MDILDRIREEDEHSIPLIEQSIARYLELKAFIDNRVAALVKLKQSFTTQTKTTSPQPGSSSRTNLPRGVLTTHIVELAKQIHPKTLTVKSAMLFLKESGFDRGYGRMPTSASLNSCLTHLRATEVLKLVQPGRRNE